MTFGPAVGNVGMYVAREMLISVPEDQRQTYLRMVEEISDLKYQLGVEVARQLPRLLAAPDPLPVLELMIGEGLLESILPEITGTAVLRRLMALEVSEREDPVLRLATLLRPGAAVARAVAQRLRLSNAEAAELELLGAPEATLGEAAALLSRGPGDPAVRHALSTALYQAGPARFRVALLVAYLRLVSGGGGGGDEAAEGSVGHGHDRGRGLSFRL